MVREVCCFSVAFAVNDFAAVSDTVLCCERLLGEHGIGDVRLLLILIAAAIYIATGRRK